MLKKKEGGRGTKQGKMGGWEGGKERRRREEKGRRSGESTIAIKKSREGTNPGRCHDAQGSSFSWVGPQLRITATREVGEDGSSPEAKPWLCQHSRGQEATVGSAWAAAPSLTVSARVAGRSCGISG